MSFQKFFVVCFVLLVFFSLIKIFLKKGNVCFSLYLDKNFWLFCPLHVLFWFLVLSVMNVQFHIGSCKMITNLFLHTVHF
jgi:hypothetical protein